jgi:hypothetical protein
MSRKLKRNAMIAIAAAAVVVGVIVVAVSSGGGHGGSPAGGHAGARSVHRRGTGTLAVAADYLGLTRGQLRKDEESGRTLAQIADATSGKSAAGLVDAIVSARAARLAEEAHAGRQTKANASGRLARLRRRIEVEVNKTVGTAGARGTAGGASLLTAARYLGVSAAELREQLLSGRSLAQIAEATHGKSTAGLIDALVSARKAKLEASVTSGRLTQSKESTLLSTLRQRITSEVDRSRSAAGKGEAQSSNSANESEIEAPEGSETS